jgi:hypothetical protein
MASTTCLVCLVSDCSKNPLEEQVVVAGTQQNLSNLLFLDIYALFITIIVMNWVTLCCPAY